ncbi:baseplate J/gp47 family protein [Neisseria sp. Ec49-e6-T10]|uniref:baseplate J/gp47 family protein n=1 Tax=Neisseria sp. Ec49-e6-T10 TaxID=3140744 RepID=UPI003EC0398A
MAELPFRKLNISDYEKQGQARLKQLAPSLDASVYGSFITNLLRSAAAAVFPSTYLVEDAFNNAFVQFAKGNVLDEFHGKQEETQRNPASVASGNIVIYANSGTTVPIGTEFTAASAIIRTKNTVTIGTRNIDIVSANAMDGLVTVNTSTRHYLPVGGLVTIVTGNADFNGDFRIVQSDDLSFQYQIQNNNPASAASGTASSLSNIVQAETNETGLSANISGNIALSGDYEAYTLPDGLVGGADQETDDEYAARLIEIRNLLEGVFTSGQIIQAAKRITGNTRVWVVEPKYLISGGTEGQAGYKPQPGQVCVYFVRDNDLDIFPNNTLIEQTKQSIIQYGKKPAHTIDEDIFVFAPIKNEVVFTISNLVPDTPEMRNAIESELQAYMQDFIDFEEGFSQQMQDAAIASASVAGEIDKTFTNSTGDILAQSGTLAVYGGVTWL